LIGLSIAVPVVIFALWQFHHRSFHDFHHAVLGVLEAWAITIFFTEWIKEACGKYRPYWNNDMEGDDGRKSFPSGHASTAFATMTFLSLWMAGKMYLFSRSGGHIWQTFIVMIPIIAAIIVAVSRVRDYVHDFVDILAGAILGAALGMFHYFLKYPSLFSKRCAHPKSRDKKYDSWAVADAKKQARAERKREKKA